MFLDTSLLTINFVNISFPNFVSMKSMFSDSYCLESVYFKNFTAQKLYSITLFQNCTYIQIVDFDNFNAKSLSDISNIFEDCNSLVSIDFTGFYSDNLKTMEWMFFGCDSLISVNF